MLKKIIRIRQAPTVFDNYQAFTEEWCLCSDGNGRLSIETLCDPLDARPEKCRCVFGEEDAPSCYICRRAGFSKVAPDHSRFDTDADALHFVMEEASRGSAYHRQAIAMAAGLPPNVQPVKIN